jgi:hypothetical protein
MIDRDDRVGRDGEDAREFRLGGAQIGLDLPALAKARSDVELLRRDEQQRESGDEPGNGQG